MAPGFSIAGFNIGLSGDVSALSHLGPCYALFGIRGRPDFRLSVIRTSPGNRDKVPNPTISVSGNLLRISDDVFYRITLNLEHRVGTLEHLRSMPKRHGRPFPLGLHLALKALVAAALPFRRGILVHGCGFVTQEGSVVAIGPSGAGKSTLAAMTRWKKVLNDEIVAIDVRTSRPHVWSTPFSNTSDSSIQNQSHVLTCGLVLAQAERTQATQLPPPAALSALARCACIPNAPSSLENRVFLVAATVAAGLRWHTLEFNQDGASVKTVVTRTAREGRSS